MLRVGLVGTGLRDQAGLVVTDFSRRGKTARAKGARGELEIRDILRRHGFADAHRNFMSGAQGGGDLADAIPDCHLEVKRVENCLLPAWWRQAKRGARPTDLVVIAHRASMQPWMATMRLTHALELLRKLSWRISFDPKVITKANPRADFMAAYKQPGPTCVIHPVEGIAMATVPFEDFVEWQADIHDIRSAA